MKKVIFGILMALSLFSCRDKSKVEEDSGESIVIVEGSTCYASSIRYDIYYEHSNGKAGDTLKELSIQPSFAPCEKESDGKWCLSDSYTGSLIAKNVKYFKVTRISLDTTAYLVCSKGQ